MTAPFLSIIGIGEDGASGLSVAAATLIAQATLVIGGARHLALAEDLIRGTREVWPSPIADVIPRLRAHRPHPVAVLASGDPFCFGVGPLLAAAFPPGDWHCLSAPSSLSLACGRLGWAQQDCDVISLCGRPIAPLATLLRPNRRVLALSEDAATPSKTAAFLTVRGFGRSQITLLEALGGPQERMRTTTAGAFDLTDCNPLNLTAITMIPDALAAIAPLTPGLDDALFEHDGQITKREIRAVTLAALCPLPGGLLWDIGTGSGSVAIEWMLSHRANIAIAIDRHPQRLARASANAQRLGVPGLRCIEGAAPAALDGLPAPDSIFIGGGAPGVIETAWAALKPRGKIVVNSVTIETDQALMAAFHAHGGALTRIGIERLTPVGTMHGYRPAMSVTQWAATKP